MISDYIRYNLNMILLATTILLFSCSTDWIYLIMCVYVMILNISIPSMNSQFIRSLSQNRCRALISLSHLLTKDPVIRGRIGNLERHIHKMGGHTKSYCYIPQCLVIMCLSASASLVLLLLRVTSNDVRFLSYLKSSALEEAVELLVAFELFNYIAPGMIYLITKVHWLYSKTSPEIYAEENIEFQDDLGRILESIRSAALNSSDGYLIIMILSD